MRFRLSAAQTSALECRDWDESPTVARCWNRPLERIDYQESDMDGLFDELTEASNAEDSFETESPACKKLANRAARSLGTLAGRFCR